MNLHNKNDTNKCTFAYSVNRLCTLTSVQYSYKVKQNRPTQNQSNIFKEVVIMCMTTKEMNEAMEQIQEWKRIKEEAEDNITTLNSKVMEFLNETEECEAVDNKGKPIRRFIGNIFKATLSSVERETVNKDEVKKLLSKDDYAKVSKVSKYQSLRIN